MARIPDAYKPYKVKQKKDWGCWAACMESWTSAVYYWKTRTYDDFVLAYGGSRDSLDTESGFINLVKYYSLNIYIFPPKGLDVSHVNYTLTEQREHGRFSMIIEQLTPNSSHARLIYNNDIEKDCIDVMEPRTGEFTTIYASTLEKTMLLSPVSF